MELWLGSCPSRRWDSGSHVPGDDLLLLHLPYFGESPYHPWPIVDVYAIYQAPEKPQGYVHLVAHIFRDGPYNNLPSIHEVLKHSTKFYSETHLSFGKNGFVSERSGGSSGYFDPDSTSLKQFLSRKGSLPRKANACLIIGKNAPNQKGFFALYRSSNKHGFSSFFYQTIQKGGSKYLSREEIQQYSFLSDFPKVRIYSAFILQQLNEERINNNEREVVPNAMKKMLYRFGLCYIQSKLDTKTSVWEYLALLSRHTMVLHPVATHVDTFASTKDITECVDDIENKILCISKNCRGEGRGGCPGWYVYALLDWGATKKRRREIFNQFIATQPQMESLAETVARTGLTQRTLTSFYQRLSGQEMQQFVRIIHDNVPDETDRAEWHLPIN